ncbi:MAG: helix-turn-helix domain-containing protein [Myxococcales bacterium]|nr:helix-turn-helix domain-containing protein [Myxococcales bacterium]
MSNSRKEVLHALGQAVRARRHERRLTLAGLGEAAGVSPRFLAALELGDGNISVARLCDVAHALGVTAAELLVGVDAADGRGGLVALLGLRGAGKSTIGPKLAERLGTPFVEVDELVEKEAGMSLAEVFELHGDAFYRKLEREVLRRLAAGEVRAVIATGGSIVTDSESFELLQRSAVTVWLKARPEAHMARVIAQGDERPMKNRSDAMSELRSLLRSRTSLYAQADHVVDTQILGIEGSVAELARALGPEAQLTT